MLNNSYWGKCILKAQCYYIWILKGNINVFTITPMCVAIKFVHYTINMYHHITLLPSEWRKYNTRDGETQTWHINTNVMYLRASSCCFYYQLGYNVCSPSENDITHGDIAFARIISIILYWDASLTKVCVRVRKKWLTSHVVVYIFRVAYHGNVIFIIIIIIHSTAIFLRVFSYITLW